MSTTMTIRLDDETKDRLDALAKAMARSKSYLAVNAIEEYIAANEWQIQQIKEAVAAADSCGQAAGSSRGGRMYSETSGAVTKQSGNGPSRSRQCDARMDCHILSPTASEAVP